MHAMHVQRKSMKIQIICKLHTCRVAELQSKDPGSFLVGHFLQVISCEAVRKQLFSRAHGDGAHYFKLLETSIPLTKSTLPTWSSAHVKLWMPLKARPKLRGGTLPSDQSLNGRTAQSHPCDEDFSSLRPAPLGVRLLGNGLGLGAQQHQQLQDLHTGKWMINMTRNLY